MNTLPPNHFLNLQRPDVFVPTIAGTPDTSTLAAHDFDVDTRTGFMPPQPPLTRLPSAWEPWEAALDDAITSRLQFADRPDLTDEDETKSERWRNDVREVSFPHALLPLVMRTGDPTRPPSPPRPAPNYSHIPCIAPDTFHR